MYRIAPLFLTLALALSGCIAGTAGGSSSLAGSRWRFIMIDGGAPVSAQATLEFHADRMGANVGCNGMGGPWRLADGRLIAGPLVSTQMWCESLMDQERAISTLLSATPEIGISGGRMTLRTGGHSAELTRD